MALKESISKLCNKDRIIFIFCLFISASLFAQSTVTIVESYNFEANGQYTEAINIMLTLEKSYPKDAFYKLRLGWLYYLSNDYVNAEVYYAQSQQLTASLEAQEGMMSSQFYRGDWLKTIRTGNQILSKYPHNFTALTNVAYSYYALGDYQNAALMYDRASAVYPFNLEVLGYLFSSYHLGNNRSKAKIVFDKLAKYSPANPFTILYQDHYGK